MIEHSKEKVDDTLVKVDKFIMHVYVLDMDDFIIFGRSFLFYWKILINVQKGELTMLANDQNATFEVLNALKF